MAELKCYRIRGSVGDDPITDFDDVVDVGDRRVGEYGPATYDDFEAKLYVTHSSRSPRWAGFVEAGFPGEQLGFGQLRSVSALLVVRPEDTDQFYAFTFGHGRYLLRDGAWIVDFGLRSALNLIHPSAESELDRSQLRVVDRKRVGANTLLTRTQAARPAALDQFDIDIFRDMIRRVTGTPGDDTWGSRVDGGDALTVTADVNFEQLGALCRDLEALSEATDYQDQFGFIDQIRSVIDPIERGRVIEAVVETLRQGDEEESMDLAPPELIDWERVTRFQFDADRKADVRRTEFRLASWLGSLPTGMRERLSEDYLRQHHLYAVDSDGSDVVKWTIWRCLSGAIEVEGQAYVLDDNEIYRVAADYLEEVDEVVSSLDVASTQLPDSSAGATEPDYNKHAADEVDGLVLLDTKTLEPAQGATRVELCDLLGPNGVFVHVKRHFTSSGLSHLFNQGLVAAQTLQLEPDFRVRARDLIEEQGGSADYTSVLADSTFNPSSCEVVYGIIGSWQGKTLVERLPFFAKVALRHAAQSLRGMGYRVTYCPIDIT